MPLTHSVEPRIRLWIGAALAVLVLAGLIASQLWPLGRVVGAEVADTAHSASTDVIGTLGAQAQQVRKVRKEKRESGPALGQASAGSFAAGPSLTGEFGSLLHRARGGDDLAANRLYRDVRLCHWYETLPDRVHAVLKLRAPESATTTVLQQQEKRLRSLNRALAAGAPGICAGTKSQDLATYLYPATLAAAKAGNAVAQACYVNGQFGFSPDSDRGRSHLVEYKKNASRFLREGIRRGDWRMAKAMEAIHAPPHPFEMFPWRKTLKRSESAKAYTYMYLLITHAEGSEGEMVHAYAELAMAREQYRLSPDDVNRAEAQADAIYSKYFMGHPQTPEAMSPCPAPRLPSS